MNEKHAGSFWYVLQVANLIRGRTGWQPVVLVMNEPFFRRFLPHWQPAGGTFFITYRLAGTLPEAVIEELRGKRQYLQSLPREPGYSEAEWRIRINKKMFALL